MEPYYKDDWVTIYHGDCCDIALNFEPDIIITDPPYPNYHKEEYGYYDGLLDIVTKFECRQLIFWSARVDFPLNYTAIHIWDKRTGNNTTQYERIFERNGNKNFQIFRHYFINSTVAAAYSKDIWTKHKSQKPQKLMKELIQKFSKPGELILDPFMGSGSTLYSAKQLGRRATGIEIKEKYCEIAAKRLSQEVLNFAG